MQYVSRRGVLKGASVLALPIFGIGVAEKTVQGAFSGVIFTLTAGGQPVAGQRVRFSISSFHLVGNSVWFEVNGPKASSRLGYLDLDTDESGTVALDQWLRRGAVSTTALGAHPLLRAQLVGSETILTSAHLSVN